MKTYSPSGFRNDWQSFKIASLDISLYNAHQKGAELVGLCRWVSTKYERCIVNLGDTLHRHNLLYVFGNPEDAYRASLKLGDEWLADNAPYLACLTIPYKIVRHDEWLNDPEFGAVHDAIWDFYRKDDDFCRVIQQDVEIFVARQKGELPPHIREASTAYLLEELAADILLGKKVGVAHFYPATKQRCYGHLVQRAHEIPAVLRGLENSAAKRYYPSRLCLVPAGIANSRDTADERQSAAG